MDLLHLVSPNTSVIYEEGAEINFIFVDITLANQDITEFTVDRRRVLYASFTYTA